MHDLIRTLPLVVLMSLAGPAIAQETPTEEPAPDPLALNMGNDPDGPGSIYVQSEHGDWEIRCIRTAEGTDPCQMYQLLADGNGNPVSEINVFPLGGEAGAEATAGATIVTPLETLLTTQLSLAVDQKGVKRYPFSWCSQIGCFARLGFTEEDVASFKAGKAAVVTIVPVAAPDQRVNLTISLIGFTAAYEEALKLQE